LVTGLVGAGAGSVVVNNWGYGAAYTIAGTVGVCCAFISIFLRQPKVRGRTSGYRRRKKEAASLALD
jgi:hypothetical protein